MFFIRSMLIKNWFTPEICYKKWYTMVLQTEKDNSCNCLVKCKYPPPSAKDLVYLTDSVYNKLKKKCVLQKNVFHSKHAN